MALKSSLNSIISLSLLISLFILFTTNVYFNSNELRHEEKVNFRWLAYNLSKITTNTLTTPTTSKVTSPRTETAPTTKALVSSMERYASTFGEGRLGNQMNNLATLYVLEIEYGPKAALIPSQFRLLRTYFYTEEFNKFARNLGHKYLFYWKLPWTDTEPNYTDPDKSKWPAKDCGKFIRIREFPLDVEVFKNYLPQLQEVFKPKQFFVEEALKRMKTISDEYRLKHPNVSDADLTFVSIHVRRTDYLQSLKFEGFPEVDLNYYHNAMEYFRERYENVLFYVLSDDAAWVQTNLGNVTYYIGADQLWEDHHHLPSKQIRIGIDHALLRQANHSIMTYGSFGMWGALLNQGGKIVIPRTHTEYETLKYMLKANLSNIVVI